MENKQEIVLAANMPDIPAVRLIKSDEMALYSHWPFLREKLIGLKRKFKLKVPHVPLRWEPEHFRFEILKNLHGGFASSNIELFLALGYDETGQESIDGFFITTLEYDSFAHLPLDFLIWIAWSDTPFVLESCMLQASEIAKARGCQRIKHMSPFLGWARRQRMMNKHAARELGIKLPEFKMQYVIWAADLYEDE